MKRVYPRQSEEQGSRSLLQIPALHLSPELDKQTSDISFMCWYSYITLSTMNIKTVGQNANTKNIHQQRIGCRTQQGYKSSILGVDQNVITSDEELHSECHWDHCSNSFSSFCLLSLIMEWKLISNNYIQNRIVCAQWLHTLVESYRSHALKVDTHQQLLEVS